MSLTIKYRLILTNILILFSSFACLPHTGYATCSQSFYFSSSNMDFSFHRNYGGKNREGRFIDDIKKFIPSILGLEKGLKKVNQFAEISIGCQQFGKAYLKMNNLKSYEFNCKNETPQRVLLMLLKQYKISIIPKMVFEGYTIQIAYANDQNTSAQEINRWENIITSKEYTSSMKIEGDCTQTPLWIQKYPNNYYGIRFGIFNTFKDAMNAIKVLKLGETHSQIMRLKFNINNLGNYFY